MSALTTQAQRLELLERRWQPGPTDAASSSSSSSSSSSGGGGDSGGDGDSAAVVVVAADVRSFLRWYAQSGAHEAAEYAEEDAAHVAYVAALAEHRARWAALLAEQAQGAARCLGAMTAASATAAAQLRSLHATTEQAAGEQVALEAQIEQLAAPLKYFTELQDLGPLLGLPLQVDGSVAEGDHAAVGARVTPETAAFAAVLARLDASVRYLSDPTHGQVRAY